VIGDEAGQENCRHCLPYLRSN